MFNFEAVVCEVYRTDKNFAPALAKKLRLDPALPTGQFSFSKLVIDEMIYLFYNNNNNKFKSNLPADFAPQIHAELYDVTHTSPGC